MDGLERARQVPKNKGEGFPGLDLNSGWNWTPTKYGWLGSSTICNSSIPNINAEPQKMYKSLQSKIMSLLTCGL